MKQSKKNQIKYQNDQRIRMERIEAEILNDSLTNPLLSRAGELSDYFKRWIDGARLVAVLPALPVDDNRAASYYSAPSLLNYDGIEEHRNIRISPVFMYINPEFTGYDEPINNGQKRFFTFDSEENKLYSYEKKKHSQEYTHVKKDTFEEMKAYLHEHPVVLFFKGCDDGHIGKRFKTEQEAMEYLQLVDVFEDVYEDKHEFHN